VNLELELQKVSTEEWVLRSGRQIRFTAAEVEEAREVGMDLAKVKTQAEFSNAVINLVRTLEQERPELLEKIAKALAVATGRKLPACLVECQNDHRPPVSTETT